MPVAEGFPDPQGDLLHTGIYTASARPVGKGTSCGSCHHLPIGNLLPGVTGVMEWTRAIAADQLEDGRRRAQTQVYADRAEGYGCGPRDVEWKGEEEK